MTKIGVEKMTNPYNLLTDDMTEEKKAEVFFGFIEEEMKKDDISFNEWHFNQKEILKETDMLLLEYMKYRDKGY